MAAVGGANQKWRIVVPFILLTMVLMRLVWMQLRYYPVTPEPRAVISLDTLRRATGVVCEHARPASTQLPLPSRGDAKPLGGLRQVAITVPLQSPLFEARPATARRLLGSAYDWLASPGFMALNYVTCQSETPEERLTVRTNQWIFALMVLLATLMTRFITSSWTIALTVAAMLFSRGALLADIGTVSVDYPIMLAVTAWLTGCAHFLRTGARASLGFAVFAMAIGAVFDRTLVVLCLPLPGLLALGFLYRRRLALPVLRRLRGTRRQLRALYSPALGTPAAMRARRLMGPTAGEAAFAATPSESVFRPLWPTADSAASFGRVTSAARLVLGLEFPTLEPATAGWQPSYQRGNLLRTLAVPFLLWAYRQRHWLGTTAVWLASALAIAIALALVPWALGGTDGARALHELASPLHFSAEVLSQWWTALVSRFDFHLSISLIIIVICALQSPEAGLTGFLECVWLLLLAGVVLAAAGFVSDAADLGLVQTLVKADIHDPLSLALGARPIMLWLEPAVLSLGVAGIYNLMKVLDSRVARRAKS